ncbi:MAG: YitT family protein [Oscillospiraceae bacterium]|jgi:uncharacterized membrane-anchored protein YitT (DUF2179 family)|nr:YitT family protein [Oscillospiraceae bacterium]
MKKNKKAKTKARPRDKQVAVKWVKDIAFIIAGSLIYSFGVRVFTLPNHIVPGGLTGVATIINHFKPDWTVGAMYGIFNIPVVIVGFFFLGWRTMVKTVVSVGTITIATDYLYGLLLPDFHFDGTGNMILVAVFGGVCLGTGLGIIYSKEGTSGGSDITNRIIHKKFPVVSLGKVILISDAVIVSLAIVVFHSVEAGLYAIISIFVETKVIDMMLYGGLEGKLLLIFSDKFDEIARDIMDHEHRGVTLLEGKSAYTGREKAVVLCAVHKNQYVKIKRLVRQIDPTAFIVITTAGEVLGQGFAPNKDN